MNDKACEQAHHNIIVDKETALVGDDIGKPDIKVRRYYTKP
jgi:hypothetical protein